MQDDKQENKVVAIAGMNSCIHLVQLTPYQDNADGVRVDLQHVSSLVDELIETYEFMTGNRAFKKDAS